LVSTAYLVLAVEVASSQAKCTFTNKIIYFIDLVLAETYRPVEVVKSSEDESAKNAGFISSRRKFDILQKSVHLIGK
jgi:hypothetical protein